MNKDNLHRLIDLYESDIDNLYNVETHDELFKWRGMQTWQKEWFKPVDAFTSFKDRFNAAKKDFGLLTDNSRMHPSAGLIDLWVRSPEQIEYMFNDVLLADSHGSVKQVQENMDSFICLYEEERQKWVPKNWSYKQDRHSASVYLAMCDPEFNYAYKSSEATTIAKYIGFGPIIGSGEHFSLENYYRLCETIVGALREHDSLLEKHFNMLTDEYYYDESLHLLAFDLMYCSRAYSYYAGLDLPSRAKISKSIKKDSAVQKVARNKEDIEQDIRTIESQIESLEAECADCDEISLDNVQVSSSKYGVGTVIMHDHSKIKVRFDDVEKTFNLNIKYPSRPTFENDSEVVAIFTKWDDAQDKIRELKKRMMELNNELNDQ